MALGILLQRRLYGWAAVVCLLAVVPVAFAAGLTGALVLANLALSFLALWQTTRVEAVADPDVTP